jgi:hypothetical protein
MILYTLLTTNTNKDITSIILTSILVYYVIYSVLPVKRNYLILAGIMLGDLYFTSNADFRKKNRPKTTGGSAVLPRPSKHVHFAPTNHMQYYQPQQPVNDMMPVPMRMIPQLQLPPSTNPMFHQYINQHQNTRGHAQPVMLNSSYHQPQQSQYYQPPTPVQQTVMIDNRHLAPNNDDSSSSSSSESVASDIISYSSEEY